jgi:DNA-binding response OmpR family regulator
MKTILIIEDNAELRETLAETLRLENWRVLEAPDGRVGVELAGEAVPNLILCDVEMPTLDGAGVFRLLHDNVKTATIPILFMTGIPDVTAFTKRVGIPARSVLRKPFDISELLYRVGQWLPNA